MITNDSQLTLQNNFFIQRTFIVLSNTLLVTVNSYVVEAVSSPFDHVYVHIIC